MHPRVVLTVLLGWLVLVGSGCVMGTAGRIPPAAFQFHEVISREGSEGGGWKVAQTTIALTRISQHQPIQTLCDVEVGLPIATKEGNVPDVVAQQEAASAADQAARLALSKRPATSAELCNMFLLEMGRILTSALKGVRVRRFVLEGIPRTRFVPE
ncbi:hypothetical protein [Myxococcus sp. RHSTA-1-4]|uniref:hypothetical protein n=1 Tax=Myxococcus sp. RHSTA-1-4 TaxID=2874601 RepID=UPI001CC0AAA6|nr:hypothetical protein [Myxococcus sp. RHSTA-1-4]MBZ4423259.1 hypothetical protein [Myxococcus sp. RHSTA-1-4]